MASWSGDVLGLKPVGGSQPTVQTYLAGRSVIVVYESRFAGTNQGTAITWPLGAGFDQAVGELQAKGVRFEHYDMPGLTRTGDVHEAGGMRARRSSSRTLTETSSISDSAGH